MKQEIRNPKPETSTKHEIPNSKRFDLEDRTFRFAGEVRHFLSNLPRNAILYDDIRQLVRSSGSVGANYLEANESLGKKDFLMKIKTAKREAKESIWWLELIDVPTVFENERNKLLKEATEIMSILGAILRNST